MKLKLKDRWDELATGDRYIEIKIDKAEACCVKEIDQGEVMYVMQCHDGNDVYSDIGGADYPLRRLTLAEFKEIMDFAREQFAVEKEMDEKFVREG